MRPQDTYGYAYPTTSPATNPKATVSPRERDDLYYKLLADRIDDTLYGVLTAR